MATVTLYVSSRKDDTKSTCCVTGQIKKKIQSKLDDSIGCSKADRLFLWSTGDKDVVDVINANSCEELQNNFTEQETKDTIHNLYKAKNDLSVRIGWQDSNKKNKFVDEAMQKIGVKQSKLPTWESALQKARIMSNGNESN